ncbi:hypothetical protein HYS94_01740 [Candidatus Daviesbacteria bacterium]|nr:hypothetical protein [Candidatus Daviesbacteria bacterium]
MAKISQQLSFTFRIGVDQKGQFAKVTVQIDEIDTELPIKEQLEKVDGALDKVWAYIKKKVDAQIDEVLDN